MKNNKGVTLVALIITIIVMSILIGITVSSGGGLLQKSKMTDYIGYMKLVKARADVVLEDEFFDGTLSSDTLNPSDKYYNYVDNVINSKGYDNSKYIIKKWGKSVIGSQGIDSDILDEGDASDPNDDEYFVIVFDKEKGETVDVLYSTGCAIESQRYYSLNDCEIAVNGKQFVYVRNLIEDGGIEQGNWGDSANGWTTTNCFVDTTIKHSGTKSLMLKGYSMYGETYCAYNEKVEKNNNNKYYISFYAYVKGETGSLIQFFWNLNKENASYNRVVPTIEINQENTWIRKSSIFTSDIDDENYLRFDFNSGNSDNSIRYDDILLVNLTEILDFNSAPVKNWTNDELKAWCDANLDYGVTEVVVPTN